MLTAIFAAVLLSQCSTYSVVSPRPTPAQRILPDPEEHGYVRAHADAAADVLLNEFVKKGDSIDDWERLVTRLYTGKQGEAETLARITAAGLKKDCPHARVEWKQVAAGEFSVEHSHDGCGKWEGHRSVRKFINGKDGVYMIAFDMKNRAYNAGEYQAWRQRILGARLIGG